MTNKIVLSLLALRLFLGSPFAFAEDSPSEEPKNGVGIKAGVGVLNQDYGTRFTMGVDYNYMVLPQLGLGGIFSGAYLGSHDGTARFTDGTVVVGTFTNTLFHLDLSISYHPFGTIDGLWIAVRPGLGYLRTSFSSTSGAAGTLRDAPLGFEVGPAIGYDLKISKHLGIATDFSYMWSFFSPTVESFQALAGLNFYL